MSQQERILARADRHALAGNQRVADILRRLAGELPDAPNNGML